MPPDAGHNFRRSAFGSGADTYAVGVRAAGVEIALLGGWLSAIVIATSASILWRVVQPEVGREPAVIDGFSFAAFATGGVGCSVPFGLLIAGIAVPCSFTGLLLRWFAISGLVIAAVGELSGLQMIYQQLLPLIPPTRFPGFIWMIVAGLVLPARRSDRR